MKAVLLPLLSASMLLIGCVEDITADDSSAFQYLQRGDTALADDKRIQIISSQSSYDDIYYRVLNLNATPQTIDFNQYQVLLVMAGSAQKVLELNVAGFTGLDNQVQIRLQTSYNASGCNANSTNSQPWLLVLFPKVDKPLVISELAEIRAC